MGNECVVTVAQTTQNESSLRNSAYLSEPTPDGFSLILYEIYLSAASIIGVYDSFNNEVFSFSDGPGGMRIRHSMSYAEFSKVFRSVSDDSGLLLLAHNLVKQANPHWYDFESVEKHLEKLTEEFDKWYDHEQMITDGKIEEIRANEEYLGIKPPVQPDCLTLYRQMASFDNNHLPLPGGLHDQPLVLMLELNLARTQELSKIKV